jgi:hypothetical protein
MRETRFINESVGGRGFDPRTYAAISRKFGYGVIGGLTFGPVGAAAGVILGGLADGANTARKLGMIEHTVKRGRKAINDSLDDIVERMAKGGPGGTIPLRPNRTKLFLGPLAAQFGEEDAKEKTSRAEDYATAKSRATKLADPQALHGAIGKIVEPINHDMPNVSAAIQAKMASGVGYVLEGFKKDNRTSDDIVMGVKERPPTDSERMKMEIKLAVLEDPTEFLRSIENRTCTGTHADAMRKLYPKLYAMCEAGIYERVTDLENAVPFVDRQVLSIAFNRPFDVSNKPENITILQASYGEKSEEGTKIKSTPLLKTMGAFGPSEVEQIAMG